MTTSAKLHAVKITSDFDDCQACNRTGLVRVVVLSDGSHVGTECMKKVLGWAITKKNADALAGFTPVAEFTKYGETSIMWVNEKGRTLETRNAVLVSVGGVRQSWVSRGWIAA